MRTEPASPRGLVLLGLDGRDIEDLGFTRGDAIPAVVSLETDHPVDDPYANLNGGGRLFGRGIRASLADPLPTSGSSPGPNTIRMMINSRTGCHGSIAPT